MERFIIDYGSTTVISIAVLIAFAIRLKIYLEYLRSNKEDGFYNETMMLLGIPMIAGLFIIPALYVGTLASPFIAIYYIRKSIIDKNANRQISESVHQESKQDAY